MAMPASSCCGILLATAVSGGQHKREDPVRWSGDVTSESFCSSSTWSAPKSRPLCNNGMKSVSGLVNEKVNWRARSFGWFPDRLGSRPCLISLQKLHIVRHECIRASLQNSVDDEFPEVAESSDSKMSIGDNDEKMAKVDLQLPRRRLLVEFTCNVCKTRTQRLINPEAYKRGTVYVQCGGCEAYHQLVDNLNLVVEYDFREENASSSS